MTHRTAHPIKTEGEIGVPCVAASCACLGVRKAITSVDENKMLPLRSTGAAPDERQRLQGQPLSWLLARSGLSWPPPYPLSGSRSSHLFVGCSRAPLVLRPCLVARPAVPLSER